MDTEQNKPKTSAKDFFLWFGAIIALYISAGSLIALLFQYINIAFPDALYGYVDPYSSSIRWSIAALIVLIPALLFLVRRINQDMRAHPEKENLAIRKWLTYFTLFLGATIIAGDLIALVNNFLGGEMTVRFALKALAIFGVVGLIFGYYFFDLRNYWRDHKPHAIRFGWAIGILVLVVIVSGFFIMGSPQTQRDLRFDQNRVNNLQHIQWEIVNHWQAHGALPSNLAVLEDSITGYRVPVDPETGEAYTYQTTGERSFELCATFNKESAEMNRLSPEQPIPVRDFKGGVSNWAHEAGEQCFSRTIDPNQFPPRSLD